VRRNAPVCDEDLDEAYERIRHGSEKNWGESYMERVAYHESGHALLCALAGRTPAYLTIVARGDHGGYMEHADGEDSPLRTREELLGRIRTALGGRAAELVRYGGEDGLSTGASGDLSQATELAAALLLRYGMDDSFGLVSLSVDRVLNSPLAPRLLEKMNALLQRELEQALTLLREHRAKLDLLSQELLRKNKLTGEEIDALLGEC
jgi:ATP-dependent Zn protease